MANYRSPFLSMSAISARFRIDALGCSDQPLFCIKLVLPISHYALHAASFVVICMPFEVAMHCEERRTAKKRIRGRINVVVVVR